MTLQRELFEQTYQVLLRPKGDLGWANIIGQLSPTFMTRFWTTTRFPGQLPVISYPTTVDNPMDPRYRTILKHELVHCQQMRSTWGLIRSIALYFFLPLPIFFSGRWYMERTAFLIDINDGIKTPAYTVELLWRSYLYPWPRTLMRRWFEKHRKPDAKQTKEVF
jgi:hypothetical protein